MRAPAALEAGGTVIGVRPESGSRNGIRDLLAVVERDLHDSGAKGLSAKWRMNIAYNAGLQAATAKRL